jgi:hypothetical protein
MSRLFRAMVITSGLLLLFSNSVTAAPVTWYITGQFTDGGTISGSYAFDGPSTFSSVNITTTAGSSASGSQYITPHPTMVQDASHIRVLTLTSGDLTSTHYLAINLSGTMTGAGGTIAAVPDSGSTYSEFTCSNAGCTSTTQLRHLSSASVTTVSPTVPALSDAAIAATALLLAGSALVFIKRRRAQCA